MCYNGLGRNQRRRAGGSMKVMVAQICFERNDFSARRSSAKGESSSPTSRILFKGLRDPLRVKDPIIIVKTKTFLARRVKSVPEDLALAFVG